MLNWNNLDTLASYQELEKAERINLAEVMSGENGAKRVREYSIPMAEGFVYNYAAKQVDDTVLAALDRSNQKNMSHCTMAQSSIPERSVWFCIS